MGPVLCFAGANIGKNCELLTSQDKESDFLFGWESLEYYFFIPLQ